MVNSSDSLAKPGLEGEISAQRFKQVILMNWGKRRRSIKTKVPPELRPNLDGMWNSGHITNDRDER